MLSQAQVRQGSFEKSYPLTLLPRLEMGEPLEWVFQFFPQLIKKYRLFRFSITFPHGASDNRGSAGRLESKRITMLDNQLMALSSPPHVFLSPDQTRSHHYQTAYGARFHV